MQQAMPVGVLFVCLGNICRSPTAEEVFRQAVAGAGLGKRIVVDSAGTGDWHVGHPPDRRAMAAARKRGYDLSALRARQVTVADFGRFDWILAMDCANLRALESLRPRDFPGHLGLFLDALGRSGLIEVPDPYTDDAATFDLVLDLVEMGSTALLAKLQEELAQR